MQGLAGSGEFSHVENGERVFPADEEVNILSKSEVLRGSTVNFTTSAEANEDEVNAESPMARALLVPLN
jgi:hypothetical protein